jgi:hypothetical protein
MNYELFFAERIMMKQCSNTINGQRERLKAFYNPAQGNALGEQREQSEQTTRSEQRRSRTIHNS